MKPLRSKSFGWRAALCALAGAFAMALAVYLTAAFLLPLWVERTLKSMLSELSDSKSVRYESLRIDVFSAEIGKLSMGGGKLPPLVFESCKLKYTPLSLLRRTLESVSLSGLDIKVSARSGRFLIEGMDFSGSELRSNLGPASLLSALGAMPLKIDSFEVKGSEIDIQGDGFSFVVPFRISLAPSDPSWSVATASVDAFPNGQRIKASFSASKASSRLVAKLWTPRKIQLEALPLGSAAPPGLSLSGILSLEARASFSGDDFHLEELEADAGLEGLLLRLGKLRLTCVDSSPAAFKLRCKGGKGALEGSWLRLGSPFSIDVKSLRSACSISGGALSASMDVSVAGADGSSPLKTPANILLEAGSAPKGQGRRETSGTLRVIGERPGIGLELDGASLGSSAAFLEFKAVSGGGSATDFDLALRLPLLKASKDVFAAEAKDLSLAAKGSLSGGVNVEALLSNASVKAAGASASLPNLALSASFKGGELSGLVSFENASASESSRGVELEGLSMSLPFKLPLPADAASGGLSVRDAKLKGASLGSLESRLALGREGLSAKGSFASSAFKGLHLDFESLSFLARGGLSSKLKFSMPPYKLAEPFDLGKLHPKGMGLFAGGELSFEGSGFVDGSRYGAAAAVKVKDAFIRDSSGLFAVEGLNASFELPHLPELRSAPSQEVSFAKASLGSLAISDGQATARLDDPGSIFIEGFKASCCGGKLRAQSFAFDLDSGDFAFVLHCDRLSIAQFLNHLDVGRAEGEGSLNGSIPLSIRDGELSFHDAFLYSTPGEPGIIRLDDSSLLTDSYQDGVKSVVLDIAREALKSYSYTWAKLCMDTLGESVVVKFQLDGKPLFPLPFRIDDDGNYVYDSVNKFTFQGIRLDLNFNVPLSKVIGLGGNFKNLLKTGAEGK